METSRIGRLALAMVILAGAEMNLPGRPQDNPMHHSLLGMSLAEAKRTEFFSWFHLQQTGKETDAKSRPVMIFQPSGGAFHELVTVRAALDNQERIVQFELLLTRSFVDDKKQGVFANDIAKSFLLDAAPRADQNAIRGLADDISSNQMSQQRVITGQPLPPPPQRPGPAYLTYLGQRQQDTEQLPSSTLHLENLKRGGQQWLRMAFSLGK